MFELFEKYKANTEKLVKYGFSKEESSYVLSRQILSGEFRMDISVQQSQLDFHLYDLETGDEYRQVHMESMTGDFVGMVREACLEMWRIPIKEVWSIYGQSILEKALRRLLFFDMMVVRNGMEHL